MAKNQYKKILSTSDPDEIEVFKELEEEAKKDGRNFSQFLIYLAKLGLEQIKSKQLPVVNDKARVVSLFSGCGGLDWGLHMAGAETIWCCDHFKEACDSLEANYPNAVVFRGDIQKVQEFPQADIVIGGYPCQGFSLAGKRLVTDERNFLYLEYIRCLRQVKPFFFIAENVVGMMTMEDGAVIEAMVREFSRQGYTVKYHLYNAKECGVPQDRERVFLVGVRNDIDWEYHFPEPTHCDPEQTEMLGLLPYRTMEETIKHLENSTELEYPTYGHSSRFMSRNRKRKWNEVSYCIQASARHAPIHPAGEPMVKLSKNEWEFRGDINRRLAWQETKLIQTFPEDYVLCGDVEKKYKQIGNAVPPLLAKFVSQPIIDYYNANRDYLNQLNENLQVINVEVEEQKIGYEQIVAEKIQEYESKKQEEEQLKIV